MEEERPEETSGDEHLSREARLARWQAKRPNIDHLEFGVVMLTKDDQDQPLPVPEPLPLFDVGGRVVVDRRTAFLDGKPWLDTTVGFVRSIDDITGLVTVWDEESDPRSRTCRYFSYRDPLQTFKLAPAKGNPFDLPVAKKVVEREPGQRRRGRPKGSRNRSKETK